MVNLDLARIAVQKGNREQALRYYHNAIYATWTDDQPAEQPFFQPVNQTGKQEAARREVRLELVKYLLGMGDRTQAQSELIALAANLEDDAPQHRRAGELFFEAQDYEHALAEYGLSLKLEPHDPAALAGAGRAAFELGRYIPAERYLEAAVEANPSDAQLTGQIKETELVVQMDPFQRQLPLAQRNGIVMEAFAAAGERLKVCPATGNWSGAESPIVPGLDLAEAWAKMKPQITERGLRGNPELMESAMELVFEIERRSNAECGAPSGTDLALLRIAKLHQEK
jgi:tetratricopeptide (TPR) repeat protein